jgi:hypothetical protein
MIMRENQAVKVLLAGIDCPEKKQPYGMRAKQYTSNLVFGKVVMVKVVTRGENSRIVADVLLSNGVILNQQLVWAGLAWWYRKYAQDDRTLAGMEAKAKAAKRGLWADPDPMPPWQWREGKRQDRVESKPAQTAIVFKGNIRAKIFHRTECRYYDCKACTETFASRDEAVSAGYMPCIVCKP